MRYIERLPDGSYWDWGETNNSLSDYWFCFKWFFLFCVVLTCLIELLNILVS